MFLILPDISKWDTKNVINKILYSVNNTPNFELHPFKIEPLIRNDIRSIADLDEEEKRRMGICELVPDFSKPKKIILNGKSIQSQIFNHEISKLQYKIEYKNKNKLNKLKIDEKSIYEDGLIKLFNSDKLKELLKQKIKISENSPINKLLESSEYLSKAIFSIISGLNIEHEIPFRNLEVNILLDCSGAIPDTEKYFVMLQVCAITTVFQSLEIPYLIAVVGDNNFKVVLKDLDEEHSKENLQKVLDCIFIKRYNANIASCIKTAIDKFKTLNKNSHRVFLMFTDGFDEEFILYEQWKNRIFVNPNHSFAFILSKNKNRSNENYHYGHYEEDKFFTDIWDKFSSFCISNNLNVELFETEFYISNKGYICINKKKFNNYIKFLFNILKRDISEDNNNKIIKASFEIEQCNNIPLNESLINLEKIISDSSLSELKEKIYI